MSEVLYPFDPPAHRAIFLNRPTRFTANIKIEGAASLAHINSSGRMQELLIPGRTVAVTPAGNPERKSPWNLKLVRVGSGWCSIDSMLPNRLVRAWLTEHHLEEIDDYTDVLPEVRHGDSRLDFQLTGGGRPWWIEVKSVTLAAGKWGIFPDAPTTRGAKHVRKLTKLANFGERCAIVWVMMHAEMRYCWANALTDPDFTAAVIEARAAGVKLLAYQVAVTLRGAQFLGPRPVREPDATAMAALKNHVETYADRPLGYTRAERQGRPQNTAKR
jgi:sugar fermentation stimulation protein A